MHAKVYSFIDLISETQDINMSEKLSIEVIINILEEFGSYGFWDIELDNDALKEYPMDCVKYVLGILLYLKINEQPSSRATFKKVDLPDNNKHILHNKLDKATITAISKINATTINENMEYLQVAVDAILKEFMDSKNRFIYKEECKSWDNRKAVIEAIGSIMETHIMYGNIRPSSNVTFQVASNPSKSKALIVFKQERKNLHIKICFNKYQYYAGSTKQKSKPIKNSSVNEETLLGFFPDILAKKNYAQYLSDIYYSFETFKSDIIQFKKMLEEYKKKPVEPTMQIGENNQPPAPIGIIRGNMVPANQIYAQRYDTPTVPQGTTPTLPQGPQPNLQVVQPIIPSRKGFP